MVVNDLTFDLMLYGAIRYYLGRHTIATHGFAEDIACMAPMMKDSTRLAAKKIIDEWLDSNSECAFGGVDDRTCWVEAAKALGKDYNAD